MVESHSHRGTMDRKAAVSLKWHMVGKFRLKSIAILGFCLIAIFQIGSRATEGRRPTLRVNSAHTGVNIDPETSSEQLFNASHGTDERAPLQPNSGSTARIQSPTKAEPPSAVDEEEMDNSLLSVADSTPLNEIAPSDQSDTAKTDDAGIDRMSEPTWPPALMKQPTGDVKVKGNLTLFFPHRVPPLESLESKVGAACAAGTIVPAYSGPVTLNLEWDSDDLKKIEADLAKKPQHQRDINSLASTLPKKDILDHGHNATGRYKTCAVVGASPLLLLQEFGPEIDSHDAVFRLNSMKLTTYEKQLGVKTTYDIVNPFFVKRALSPEYVRQRPCPQVLLRHELLVWYPQTRVLIMKNDGMEVLVRKQPPLFSRMDGIAPGHNYTKLVDFDYTPWLLITDSRTATVLGANSAREFVRWGNAFPIHCPRPRILHPSFDVFTKKFAGLPQTQDYSTGLMSVMLAATMCDSVTLFGFGGPVGSDGIGHYDDPRIITTVIRDRLHATLNGMRTKIQDAEAKIQAMPSFDAEAKEKVMNALHSALVNAPYYHPIAQERKLLAEWTGGNLYDLYLIGRLRLDMSKFYRCPSS